MGQATADKSIFLKVADAVVDEIKLLTLSADAIVSREIAPEFELEELDRMRIIVTSKTETVERVSRGSIDRDVEAEVAILQRAGRDETAKIETVLRVADEIAANFRKKRKLETLPGALFVSLTRPDPAFDPEYVRQYNQAATFFSLLFRFAEATS